MSRRAVVMLVGLAFVMSLGSPALSQEFEFPPHPHMLVQRPEFGFVDGSFGVLGWRKCVDLAANQAITLKAHHNNVHFGTAGAQLDEKAGHAIVPGSPLTPWANCAELEAALPILFDD